MIDKELLAKEAKSFGVSLSSATVDILDSFSVYVSEQNKLFNLTAITEGREFTEKHLIDSLSAVQFIPENSTLCDIGAGAGFPSFPIAAVRRDVNVTALDSTSKKTSFIYAPQTRSGFQIFPFSRQERRSVFTKGKVSTS